MRRALAVLALLWVTAAWSRAAEPPPSPLRARIQALLAAIEESTTLDAVVKEKAAALGSEALRQLDAADASRSRAEEFKALAVAAPAAAIAEQKRLEALTTAPVEQPGKGLSLDEAQEQLTAASQKLRAAAEALKNAKSRNLAWQERRRTLPDDLRDAHTRLAKARQEEAAPAPEKVDVVGQAAGLAHQARRLAAEAALQQLEQELASLEATERLLPLEQEARAVEERRLKDTLRQYTALVEQLRRQDAEQDRERAKEEVATLGEAHPAIQELAAENLRLTNRRVGPEGLVPLLERAAAEAVAARQQLESLKASHTSVMERLKIAGMTNTMGMLLRKHRVELPDIRSLPRRIRSRQDTMADVQLELIGLAERRDKLLSLEEELQRILGRLEPEPTGYSHVMIETRIRELLAQRRAALKALIADANAYFNTLVELDALERQLITETRMFAEFIDEHVLWIRSAPVLTAADLPRALAALGWLFGSGWADVLTALWDDLIAHSILALPVFLLLAALFVERHRLTRQLQECSDQATQARRSSYLLTVRSVLCTLGIALPVPALILFLGWRLDAAPSGSDLANAAGHALTRTALLLLPLAFFVHICRVRGLGGAHFRWPAAAIEQGRRVAILWAVTVLPLLFVTIAMESQPNEAHKSSLGRIAFIAATLLTAVVMFALLRKNSPVLAIAAKSTGGVVLWTRWLWFPFILGAPPLLALTAFMGFGFTAIHLFGKLLATFLLLLGLVVVQELILRWVYLVQLRLALEERDRRLQEAFEEQRQRAEEEGLPEVTAITRIQEKGVSFENLRHQTRALLRWILAIVGLFGLYIIWADVLPALGILKQFALWGTPIADGGGGEVTAADLLFAALTVLAAFIAARNLPAVLEMILLRHLPMDSGTRYAATAIARYAVTAVGVVFVAVFIGISWSSVQWLIAALTVGLGFGLQEIFANFISGLILLFERPIRVGDTVTIGDVIGTVTRIRIRATTITDWERKELVVPNKEFITGRLINWTLSDDVIRARVRVGIAYGSDTAKARELLLQAASENRRVLDDPAPVVLFEAFGSSSLDFELRVFVHGIAAFRIVHSELNLRIDELFREAGIEIAFPQQDLHIRSFTSPNPLQPPKQE